MFAKLLTLGFAVVGALALIPAVAAPSDVRIINLTCTGNPETVTIHNSGPTISLAGFYLQSEPTTGAGQNVALTGTLAAGESRTYQAGSAATGANVLHTDTIYRDSGAPDWAR